MNNSIIVETIKQHIFNGNNLAIKEILLRHRDLIGYDSGSLGPWLSWAAFRENQELVQILLDLGADVHQVTANSDSDHPITFALVSDSPGIVLLLLQHGADPNCDRTLISAIVGTNKHSLEMVKLLEQYGADLHRVVMNENTDQPMNALSAAIDWDKDDVADYLRSKGVTLPDLKPRLRKVESLRDEIIAHFEAQFGPVQSLAVKEVVPNNPSIDVNIIPATKEHPYVTLFTTGMSDKSMTVPEKLSPFRFGELFIQLPADWKPMQLDDLRYAWPVLWLKKLAQLPHVHNSCLGPFGMFPNGNPPEPLADNVKFDSMLVVAEQKVTPRDGRLVYLYRMTPLFPEERSLVDRMDLRALMNSFDRRKISNVVNLKRANAGI